MKVIKTNLQWEYIKLDILNIHDTTDKSLLTEDMFQIKTQNYIIDSGWYSNQETFITFLIENQEWLEPKIIIKSQTLEECKLSIQWVVEFVEKLLFIEI